MKFRLHCLFPVGVAKNMFKSGGTLAVHLR